MIRFALAVLSVGAFVAACGPTFNQDLADCRITAFDKSTTFQSDYPGFWRDYIRFCMEKCGYVLNVALSGCARASENKDGFETTPECYDLAPLRRLGL
jgi:hypothetical protein